MTTGGPVASISLEAFDRGPASWRQTKRVLCQWQATGRALLAVAGQPVDLVSIAGAATIGDLPRPPSFPAAPFVIVVYDRQLAHGLVRLAAMFAARDRPPPDDPRPIGSQP